jgi:hypothetical protein
LKRSNLVVGAVEEVLEMNMLLPELPLELGLEGFQISGDLCCN